jgi:hypothetical protein
MGTAVCANSRLGCTVGRRYRARNEQATQVRVVMSDCLVNATDIRVEMLSQKCDSDKSWSCDGRIMSIRGRTGCHQTLEEFRPEVIEPCRRMSGLGSSRCDGREP